MTEQEPAALTDDVRLAAPALAIKTPAHKQVLYNGANAADEEKPPAGGFSVWCSKRILRKKTGPGFRNRRKTATIVRNVKNEHQNKQKLNKNKIKTNKYVDNRQMYCYTKIE